MHISTSNSSHTVWILAYLWGKDLLCKDEQESWDRKRRALTREKGPKQGCEDPLHTDMLELRNYASCLGWNISGMVNKMNARKLNHVPFPLVKMQSILYLPWEGVSVWSEGRVFPSLEEGFHRFLASWVGTVVRHTPYLAVGRITKVGWFSPPPWPAAVW
jgi:hypothetical protein